MNQTINKLDLHNHSQFSPDATDTMDAMCAHAVQQGLAAIAFTEHAEWHPRWHTMPAWDRYFAEIERCRAVDGPAGLTVLSGVELGNPHDHAAAAEALCAAYPFDVIVAAQHWLDGRSVQMEGCFHHRRPNDVYAAYFSALGEMAATTPAHIVAHFDRILWRGTMLGSPLQPRRVEGALRDCLATIAWRGPALELNTRFLRAEPNWRDELLLLLRWFREEGGRKVVISSDAHNTWQLGANGDLALDLLAAAGLAPAADLAELQLDEQRETVR